MRNRLWVPALIFLLAGCSTTFLAYEGRQDLIFEGVGGARTIVDGVDFWQHGDPPRTYQLIGYIKDKRGRGLISTLTKESNVATKAREFGGDAVIVLEANQTITGYARTAFVSGNRRSAVASAISVPIGRSEATFAVLKYVEVPGQAAESVPLPASIPLGPRLAKPQAATGTPSSGTSNPYAAPDVSQPLPPTSRAPSAPATKYGYAAEKLARDQRCIAPNPPTLVSSGPGFETFSVACTVGDPLLVRCEFGACRVLQ